MSPLFLLLHLNCKSKIHNSFFFAVISSKSARSDSPVKRDEIVIHAEDRAGAALKRGFVDDAEDAGQSLVRRDGLFDLQRAELPIALQNDDPHSDV